MGQDSGDRRELVRLTILATLVLLVEAGVVRASAAVAAAPSTSGAEILALPPTLVHSIGGLIVLLAVQVLNFYKPAGLTPYGWRKQQEERQRGSTRAAGANGPTPS